MLNRLQEIFSFLSYEYSYYAITELIEESSINKRLMKCVLIENQSFNHFYYYKNQYSIIICIPIESNYYIKCECEL